MQRLTYQPKPETALYPHSYRDAMRGILDPGFLQGEKWQEQQWRANRVGAHPAILDFEKRLVRRMAYLRVPMFASEVVRDGKRQDMLFVQGVSNAKAGQSPHQYGCAVDIVHSVRGWGLEPKQWELLGHMGKEIARQTGVSITWGGDFRTIYDPAHWELTEWRSLKQGYPFG